MLLMEQHQKTQRARPRTRGGNNGQKFFDFYIYGFRESTGHYGFRKVEHLNKILNVYNLWFWTLIRGFKYPIKGPTK